MSKPNLWAPWRMDYLEELGGDNPPGQEPKEKGGSGCFLCDAAEPDLTPDRRRERLVLRRDDHGVVLLNRYPYTNGHLLVAPLVHVAGLTDLDAPTRAGLMELCDWAVRLLTDVVNPQGFNVGANLGRAAGAGVPGHLHFHVVPRWAGDTNFMDVVGGVRVIPQALEASYARLSAAADACPPR
ncbi:MAG: HIT domain-containing protein [Planctomycetota bacterium]